MLERILDRDQDRLVADERKLLAEIRAALAELGAGADDLATLDRSIEQLDELFLLVVAGEFNAGKSAFVNALVGEKILAEGVTPTTAGIHVLGWGETVDANSPPEAPYTRVTAPVELLRRVNIVDTPGTNAIQREHEAITRGFVPRSDLVLFVTSADRPFTESERAFLDSIREWGKKIVVVINKIDILESQDDVERVVAFVTEGAGRLLGEAPPVFSVSARRALAEKSAPGRSDETPGEAPAAPPVPENRFAELEAYVADTLDETQRLRLKLANPLGVARRLAERHRAGFDERLDLLADDLSTLEDIERQLATYREEMAENLEHRLASIDNVLHELEARGMKFFDQTLRIGRVFDLINRPRMEAEFQRDVVADAPRQVEEKVDDLIDWLVRAELQQWQAVTRHVERRRDHHADRIVGEVGGSFDYDRERLLATIGKSAARTVESYDPQAEAERMAEAVQASVASAALLEAGALGLGAAITLVATSAAVDVTGLVAAGTLAALGLFVLPHRRQRAKAELAERIGTLRTQLLDGLCGQFEREMERSTDRLAESIAPYTRFVRAEREHLAGGRDRLVELDGRLDSFSKRLEGL